MLSRLKNYTFLTVAAVTLGACSGVGGIVNISKFDDVKTFGSRATLGGDGRAETLTNAQVGTVAYDLRNRRGATGFVATSGHSPNPRVGGPVTSGTAVYDATYAYESASNFYLDGDLVRSPISEAGGDITLTANFDNGTLKGKSADLVVDGDIEGRTVSGTVDVRLPNGRMDADLKGMVGSTAVIGAFNGATNEEMVAGGFVGERN